MDLTRQALLMESNPGASGSGVTVGVLDSGVDSEHPDLLHAVRVSESCRTLDGTLVDTAGHGTHVAGIIAGSGELSDGVYRGVAPSVDLLSIKVAGARWTGITDDVVQGILRAVELGAEIINYSGGMGAWRYGPPPWKWSKQEDPLSRALALAEDSGVLVVVAAGNDGPLDGSINRPGILRNVLTVGAVDRSGALAEGSSRGPVYLDPRLPRGAVTRADLVLGDLPEDYRKPDVVAPGGDLRGRGNPTLAAIRQTGLFPGGVVATRSGSTTWLPPLDESGPLSRYCRITGTSQATAVVSGLAALALEYSRTVGVNWESNTAQALRGLLRTAAQPLAAGGVDGFGHGRLTWPNVRALIEDCATDGSLRERIVKGPQIRVID